METNKDNFYCVNVCCDPEFTIKEWNKKYKALELTNLSEAEKSEQLHPKKCETQCVYCACIVGARRIETKKLIAKMETNKQNSEIEKAKTEYSAVYNASNKAFTEVASSVLGIFKSRLEVRRHVADDVNFGKLTVFVYREGFSRQYYDINACSKVYANLPSNIVEFEKELRDKATKS